MTQLYGYPWGRRSGSSARKPQEVDHPTPSSYIKIAAILGTITAIEVGAFYVEVLEPIIIPVFLLLSVVKFAMVAMYYMHLKFDNLIFTGLFAGALILAASIMMALLTLFGALTPDRTTSDHDTATSITEPVEVATTSSGDQIFLIKGCGACHSISDIGGAVGTIGPNLDGLAARTTTRNPSLSPEEYIRESIENPGGYVVDGFPAAMPSLRAGMSDNEFDSLVAYLLTLK